jgi:hypothetical protein
VPGRQTLIYHGAVEMERRTPPAKPNQRIRGGLPLPARIAIGALAVFGTITLVTWVITSLLAIVKIALLIVVIISLGAWAISAKGSR